MAVLTDDCDIRQVYFLMHHGGNGDYYIELLEYKKDEWVKTLDCRFAMSGGTAPTPVKLAIANLYRAMEEAGLNKHPMDDKNDKI